MMLVGLEAGNELGGSPDRPMAPMRQAIVEEMIARLSAGCHGWSPARCAHPTVARTA